MPYPGFCWRDLHHRKREAGIVFWQLAGPQLAIREQGLAPGLESVGGLSNWKEAVRS
jgi:hypothetical protein